MTPVTKHSSAAKRLSELAPAFLLVTLAAVALKSPLPYAAWLGYSAIISKLTGTGLMAVAKDDAKTYVAAVLLFFLPLTGLVRVPQEFERFAYLPGAIIITVAACIFVALKAYFLAGLKVNAASWLGSLRRISASSGKIAFAMASAYAALFAALSVAKHYAFNTRGIDLGIFDQTLWGLAHGNVIFSTVVGDYLFSHHSFFLFFPLAALYRIVPRVEFLLVLQSLIIALGALPLFKLARSKLGRKAALAVVAIYLTYPALNYITLEDFHIENFAVTAILFSLYYLEQKRELLFLLTTGLTALIKEDAAITAAAIGVYAVVIKRRWKTGIAAILISLAIFFAATKLFIPHFSQSGAFVTGGFGTLGNTPFDVLKNALLHPLSALAIVARPEKLAYLIMLVLPAGGLPILAPEFLIGAAPAFAVSMLSDAPQRYSIFFHYNANLIPFIFLAMIAGLSRAKKIVENLQPKWKIKAPQANAAVMTFLVSAAILSAYFYGPLPLAKNFSYSSYDFNSDYAKAGRELSAMIPADASVSASNTAAPHLSQRESIYVFPNPFHKTWYLTDEHIIPVDYVLIDLIPGREGLYTKEEFTSYVNELIDDESYGIVARKDAWLLLKRGEDHAKGICKNYRNLNEESFISFQPSAEISGILSKC